MVSFRSIVFFMMLATITATPLSAMNECDYQDLDLELYKKSREYFVLFNCLQKKDISFNPKNPTAYCYNFFCNLLNPLKNLCKAYGHDLGALLLRDACGDAGKRLEDIKDSLANHTLLFLSVYDVDLTKLLLKASDNAFEFVCLRSIIGETVLHQAALSGQLEMARLLLDTFSSKDAFHLLTIKNRDNKTAAEVARFKADGYRIDDQRRNPYVAIAEFLETYIMNKHGVDYVEIPKHFKTTWTKTSVGK